ncbi:hypothetical protein [Actinoplanes regularis]|uniref:Mce-associated membrane protein n=1 Tax=Actinoplanes regularis TaxID=52697 RepID=A0A239EXN2_9ACTN|nr:hypothetical protein [Actinoplanes regularis]GIE89740.1 hypothetical protein Are01nite_62200 [Actinoplanes regularis]SNS49191.1 hypothetical protein SAMN06264365_116155 [Actinoplanes regularis]
MRRTNNPRSTLAAVLAMALIPLAACTDSDPSPVQMPTTGVSAPAPVPSSPPSVSSAAPVTPADAKQQALAAYLGMQDAFAAASRTSDPDYPDLRKYTTGTALDLFTTALTKRKKQGVVTRGDTISHAKVTSVSPAKAPTQAVIEDCMDTRKTALYKANGDPVSSEKGGFRLALADLKFTNGAWKVTALAVRGVGSCRP